MFLFSSNEPIRNSTRVLHSWDKKVGAKATEITKNVWENHCQDSLANPQMEEAIDFILAPSASIRSILKIEVSMMGSGTGTRNWKFENNMQLLVFIYISLMFIFFVAWWEKWNSFCPIFCNCGWENKETDVVVGTVGVKQSHPFLYPPSSSNLDQFHFSFFE